VRNGGGTAGGGLRSIQVVARLEAASRVQEGEEAELWFNAEHLHLFNPDNGESLLAPGDGKGATPSRPSAQPRDAKQQLPVARTA
jgi:hypothetical protein